MDNLVPITLKKLEVWITKKTESSDGWTDIKPFLIIRLITNSGLEGWGEAFVLPKKELGVAHIIISLLTEIKTLSKVTPYDFRNWVNNIAKKHRGMEFSSATSAIEMALWDITGKMLDKSLCSLLGGKSIGQTPVYANSWSSFNIDISTLVKRTQDLVHKGFKSIKLYPLQHRTIDEGAECMKRVREAIDRDVNLMVDLTIPEDETIALAFARLIKPFNPYWLEEPVDGERTSILASIKQQIDVPVVTGEKQFELPHFEKTINAEAADILNPDIAGVGGMQDFMEISHMAAKNNIKVSPHCWNTMTIAATAMIHVCLTIPNSDHAEIFPDYFEFCSHFSKAGFKIENGKATINNKSGLGVEVKVNALTIHSSFYDKKDL